MGSIKVNIPITKKGKAGTLYRTSAPVIGVVIPIIANKNTVKAKQKRINFKEYLFGFLYQAIAPPINTKINKFSKKEATNSGF